MKKQRAETYHIIGGGIAGLSCAKFIKEKNPQALTIIYEASDHLGGRCYSYDDADLGVRLDNATHAIIGANHQVRKLLGNREWNRECWFWDVKQDQVSNRVFPHKDLILRSMCNTEASEISPEILKTIYRSTFPWTRGQRKIYVSQHNLSQRLINPLQAYADMIRFNCKLLKIESQFGQAAQLNFNQGTVDLRAEDKIILALNARAYQTLMGGEDFDYSRIINIFYRTSQPITLPKLSPLMGVLNGYADWIFVSGTVVGATISAADAVTSDLPGLARQIWQELDILRGVNSAFVPPFKIFNHKTATIRQDRVNNARRPDSAATRFPNVFIAGDWTMKNHPCCLETAVLSAKRAIKAATACGAAPARSAATAYGATKARSGGAETVNGMGTTKGKRCASGAA